MPSVPGQLPVSESPLYIRWGPDRCPYAIELKLELVERLRKALIEASAGGMEIGGVLVGLLPTPQMPTLRIEDVELLARRAEDGATFMLEGGGGERFAEVRRRARAKERSAVGLFRSHFRSGALRPSLADRSLLAGEFKEPVYALLIADGLEPFNAAFFVASNGPLPAETSVREFKLDPAAFEALPELEPEVALRDSDKAPTFAHSKLGALSAIALVAMGVIGALYYFNQSLFKDLLPSPQGLDLKLQAQDGLLRISWGHDASDLDQSTGALLTIRAGNGGSQRQVHLGLDELRLGAVVYENRYPKVEVELSPVISGRAVRKSATWGK